MLRFRIVPRQHSHINNLQPHITQRTHGNGETSSWESLRKRRHPKSTRFAKFPFKELPRSDVKPEINTISPTVTILRWESEKKVRVTVALPRLAARNLIWHIYLRGVGYSQSTASAPYLKHINDFNNTIRAEYMYFCGNYKLRISKLFVCGYYSK